MPQSELSDVFISYRRTDVEFAKKLVEALQAQGKEVWVDWEDIPPGSEQFTEDIKRGLEGADAVLCVLTPDYLDSHYCTDMELNYAVQLRKKLIPVVHRKFEGRQVPPAISHINWIYFTPHAGYDNPFDESLAKVVATMEADLDHARTHRKLQVRAIEWADKGRRASFLLSGDAIEQAEAWLGSATGKTPAVTELHTEYIFASRKHQTARTRRLLGGVTAALIVTLVLAVVAAISFREANTARAAAVGNLLQAWEIQSRFLIDISHKQLNEGMPETALLTGLESMQHYPDVFDPDSYSTIYAAMSNPLQEIAYLTHTDETTQVFGGLWDADGTRVLTWANDNKARLWDVNTGQGLEFEHDGNINGARWVLDDARVMTWAADDTLRLWDSQTGELLSTLTHETSVLGAEFAGDGIKLITWTLGGDITVWDAASETVIDTYNHGQQARGALWVGDDVISWSEGNTLIVRDVTNGSNRHEIVHPSAVEGAVLAPDGHRLLTWTLKGELFIRDLQGDVDNALSFKHSQRVSGAVWNQAGTQVLSRSEDNTARLWQIGSSASDAASSQSQSVSMVGAYPHDNWVLGAAYSHDERRIATWSVDGTAKIWMAGRDTPPLVLPGNGSRIIELHWSKDDQKVLLFTGDNAAFLYDVSVAPPRATMLNHGTRQTLTSANWSPDESLIVTSAFDGSARIWNVNYRMTEHVMKHDDFVKGATWNSDYTRVLTWSNDGTARLWQAGQDPVVMRHNATVAGAVWNADESKVLTWSWDGAVTLWDAATLEPVSMLHETSVNGAAFAGDNILSWTQGGAVTLWTPSTGEQITVTHNGPVTGAALNGDRFASWSADSVVNIWDMAGQQVASQQFGSSIGGARWVGSDLSLWTIGGEIVLWDGVSIKWIDSHDTEMRGAAWSSDNSRILTWSNDGTVRIWQTSDGKQLYRLDYKVPVAGAMWNKSEDRVLFWQEGGGAEGQGAALIWTPESGQLTTRIGIRGVAISGAAWSPDENRVLTWSPDNIVRVWTLDNSIETLILQHPSGSTSFENGIWSAVWDDTGSRVMTVPSDGSARIWVVDIPAFIQLAQQHKDREFLSVELQSVFLASSESAPNVVSTTFDLPAPIPTSMPVLLEGTLVPTALPNPEATDEAPENVVTVDEPLALLAGYVDGSETVDTVDSGEQVRVIASYEEWMYVDSGDTFGWVEKALVGETAAGCDYPGDAFARTWALNYSTLGCATDEPKKIFTAVQPYMNGVMMWRSDTRNIFVVLFDGTWAVYDDTYSPRDELTCSGYYIAFGFGKVYCSNPEVQSMLGKPLTSERAATLHFQTFEHGQIVEILNTGRLALLDENRLVFR